jgi:hypothetical protein
MLRSVDAIMPTIADSRRDILELAAPMAVEKQPAIFAILD